MCLIKVFLDNLPLIFLICYLFMEHHTSPTHRGLTVFLVSFGGVNYLDNALEVAPVIITIKQDILIGIPLIFKLVQFFLSNLGFELVPIQ